MEKTTKKILCLFSILFCLFCWQDLSAQERQVSGTVTDTQGEALIGVSVSVKGSTVGTVTDFDGKYVLSVPGNAKILEAKYIGMKTAEIPITGTVINIEMKEDHSQLDEVVVIGYGTIKKNDLTGSVGSVSSDNITAKGTTSVMESLQGQVAGVDISQNSSRAGGGFDIQIRGKSSLQGDSKPLYVVDGIVTDGIDFLNPADIERLDVLKDASSTAIYGSRATNGVVMITTKQGKAGGEGRVSVSYDGYYGVRSTARMPDFMSGDEFSDYRFARYTTLKSKTDGIPVYEMTSGNLSNFWNSNSEVMKRKFAEKDYTNWPDLVTQTGSQQNHFISINGGSKMTSYRIGLGYQDEEGIFVNDTYKRYNIKGSVDSKISDKVTVGLTTNLAMTEKDFGSKNAVLNSFRTNPYFIPYDKEGNLVLLPGGKEIFESTGQFSSIVNPLIDMKNAVNNTKRYDILANFYAQYTPTSDITLKTTFSPSYYHDRQGIYNGVNTAARYSIGTSGAEVINQDRFTYTWDNQVNYQKSWGDHDFNGMYLFSVYENVYNKDFISVTDMPFDAGFHNLGSATTVEDKGSSYVKYAMLSHALRFNYTYKGKYLATVSSRWDGSSKFSSGNRWGMFPSLALAWRASEESFLKNDYLSNLKLRFSFGYTGNNGVVGAYSTQSLASTKYWYDFGGTLANGFGPNGIVYRDLTWEKSREFNFGVDFGFFNGRINGSVDYYNKLSKDLLMDREMPYEIGATSKMWDNVGKVRNSGVEVALTTVNVATKDWKWTTSFTFAANKNSIVELYGKKEDLDGNKWFIGQPIDVSYGYKVTGVWTAAEAAEAAKYGQYEGQAKILDVDKPYSIGSEDMVILGHAEPDWTGNLTSNLYWKDFDFSFSIYSKQGSHVYSPFMTEFTDYKDRGRSKLKIDYYIPAGAPILNADGTVGVSTGNNSQAYPYPNNSGSGYGGGVHWGTSATTAGAYSNQIVDASFVKVKNITFGYNIPKNLLSKAGVSSLRVYMNILNPFVFTDYKGFDPEWAGASVSDGSGGPSSVTYQFGVNLKF